MSATGPEVMSPHTPQPETAVVCLAPKIEAANEALQTEGFFSPEGYNVLDPDQAEEYLTKVHNRTLPKIRGELDASTGYHLAVALERELREARDKNGSRQSVATHSFNLTTTASWTALGERPELDAGKAAIMANFHDLVVEAYGGDTPIHDEEKMKTKDLREAAGMTLFLRDAGDNPIADIMREYEEGRTPEARFVKGMDKVEAYQHSLENRAFLHRKRKESFVELVEGALPKAAIDPTALSKMKTVLKNLGRKWHEWGCEPFEGDPEKIVESIAKGIIDQGAEVIELSAQEPEFVSDNASDAEIIQLPEPEQLRQRRANKVVAIGNRATVYTLAEWRQEEDDPSPPSAPAGGRIALSVMTPAVSKALRPAA